MSANTPFSKFSSEVEMESNWDKLLEELPVKNLINVFELIPDLLFWIKDHECRVVYANKVYIEHVGYQHLPQVIGKTDMDWSPLHLAKQYMLDDKQACKGKVVTNKLEMNFNKSGDFVWFSTTKRPLYDENNIIIGSYGITRHFQKASQALSTFESLKVPIDYIRKNYHTLITLEHLADLTHLSISALERRFKKHLGKTPTKFINEVRLEHARLLVMDSDIPISKIAYKTGFSNHSYFTKQFRQFFGIHPTKMREQVIDK